MVGSLYGEGGTSPGYVSSTEKWKEFLNAASGSVTTGISSIVESAPEYYRNIGGGDISASVSGVLGDMAANISPYTNGIREYALNVSEEAQPYVSGKLRVLRSKVREKIPFEVRSYIPEVVRNSVDKIIKMNEKSGREKWEEKMRNASMSRSSPPSISSYDTASEHRAIADEHSGAGAVSKHIPTPIDLGCCEDFVLCKNLFGGFDDEEESQSVKQSALENTSHDVTLSESRGKKNSGFWAGVYAHYHVNNSHDGEDKNPGDKSMNLLSVYSGYYEQDIEKEDRERENRVSSAESAPSTNVADVHLTANANSAKKWIKWL